MLWSEGLRCIKVEWPVGESSEHACRDAASRIVGQSFRPMTQAEEERRGEKLVMGFGVFRNGLFDVSTVFSTAAVWTAFHLGPFAYIQGLKYSPAIVAASLHSSSPVACCRSQRLQIVEYSRVRNSSWQMRHSTSRSSKLFRRSMRSCSNGSGLLIVRFQTSLVSMIPCRCPNCGQMVPGPRLRNESCRNDDTSKLGQGCSRPLLFSRGKPLAYLQTQKPCG